MPTQSLLALLGSKGSKETRYAPIFTDRFFVGYWSNRNPLRSPLSTLYADGWHLGGTDAIYSGTNVELSPRLTICRRPGNLPFSTVTFPTPPLTFYPFRLFGATSPAIDVIVDTAATVYTMTQSTKTDIFDKSMNAGQANFLGIGQTLYFGDGAEVKAWQNGAIRNWGISIAPFGGSAGTKNAGTGSGATWTNPGGVVGSGGGFATIQKTTTHIAGPPSPTGPLQATNFGYSISASVTILGVEISFNCFANRISGTGLSTDSFSAQLLQNGNPVGNPKIFSPAPTSAGIITLGGPDDLWGASFQAGDINSSTWGVEIRGVQSSLPATPITDQYNVQAVQAVVFITVPPTVSVSGSGSFSATVGYSYVAAYGNSQSGQVSSATPPSPTTGPFTSAAQANIGLVASTDPQVDQIWLFRTADGGSTWLNLPTSPYPNVTGTVIDSATDDLLNILQQAPLNFVNNPPPANSLDPVYYLGLVWVHYGNVVQFSRVASAIVGTTQESFPPGNVFAFPETVIRKIPITNGLLVFTTSNIYIILGNNTSASVLYSTQFLTGYGVQSWNALWTDGSIIYFFTSDYRMIELNPSSGVSDLGFPIGDQLSAINPMNAYVTYNSTTSNDVALYIADGSTGWYRCNVYQAPDGGITGPVWSPKATIVGGLGALVAMETSPGIHQLMMGGSGTDEPVLVRDSTYTNFTDNGATYPSNYVLGSIVLAQPGQYAKCRFVTADFIRIGTSPIVSVLLGEVSGSFESISGYFVPDPPYLPASTSLYNNRYYFKQTVSGQNPAPVVCRHLQVKFDYGTDAVQNEMLSFTINGAIENEK